MDYIGSFHCIYHTPQRICMIVKEKKFQKYDCHKKKKKKEGFLDIWPLE